MKQFVLLMLFCAGCASAVAQVALPTLEEVIFLDSAVDQDTVYLGEEIQLTLTFGQLKFRGIRVQNFYKTSAVRLPEMEGFFAEEPRKETHEQNRGGFDYVVTTYRINLYPTRSGQLFIGAWRWQGMARGFTSEGARSIEVDKKTDPITVEVLPLPPAPADFSGAIGVFGLEVTLAPEIQQGVPTMLHVDVFGKGNPQTLRPPQIPSASWHRAREIPVDAALYPAAQRDGFLKRFSYEITPLESGDQTLAPVAMTFFSPKTKDYQTVTSNPVAVAVEASGDSEELVVVGGGGYDLPVGLLAMEDGRLPLVAQWQPLERPWFRVRYLTGLSLVPVVLFFLVWGVAFWKRNAHRGTAGSQVAYRVESAMGAEASVDGLRQAILQELRYATGLKTAGMSAPELQAALAQRVGLEVGTAISDVLHWCETMRYGTAVPSPEETRKKAQQAIGALNRLVVAGMAP